MTESALESERNTQELTVSRSQSVSSEQTTSGKFLMCSFDLPRKTLLERAVARMEADISNGKISFTDFASEDSCETQTINNNKSQETFWTRAQPHVITLSKAQMEKHGGYTEKWVKRVTNTNRLLRLRRVLKDLREIDTLEVRRRYRVLVAERKGYNVIAVRFNKGRDDIVKMELYRARHLHCKNLYRVRQTVMELRCKKQHMSKMNINSNNNRIYPSLNNITKSLSVASVILDVLQVSRSNNLVKSISDPNRQDVSVHSGGGKGDSQSITHGDNNESTVTHTVSVPSFRDISISSYDSNNNNNNNNRNLSNLSVCSRGTSNSRNDDIYNSVHYSNSLSRPNTVFAPLVYDDEIYYESLKYKPSQFDLRVIPQDKSRDCCRQRAHQRLLKRK